MHVVPSHHLAVPAVGVGLELALHPPRKVGPELTQEAASEAGAPGAPVVRLRGRGQSDDEGAREHSIGAMMGNIICLVVF